MLPLPAIEESELNRPAPHQPVLLREALGLLAPRPGMTAVDLTLGPGGHAEALLSAIAPDGRLYGIDRDRQALQFAADRLTDSPARFTPIHGDHHDLSRLLAAAGQRSVDLILGDLGLSSLQLDDPDRGFSFSADGPLDMRMDRRSGMTAAGYLAECTEDELKRALWSYGEERMSGAIARAVLRERAKCPITRTGQLAQIVSRVLGARARRMRIHPATRTFQAIRCVVNNEIDRLGEMVRDAVALLAPGGRIAVIAYHSLEDRAIKRAFTALARSCVCPPRLPVCGCGKKNLLKILTRKPLRPTEEEIENNPRSRSAKLRAAERL
jgi:16S rRNA (cytosine1402-N4)-methyltransferase